MVVIVNLPPVAAELMTNSPLVNLIVQTPPAVQLGSFAGMEKMMVSSKFVLFAEAIALKAAGVDVVGIRDRIGCPPRSRRD